jgi:tRNA(fMet)-specific endonuclease VapC
VEVNLALDTSRYTDFARGVPEAAARIREATSIVMPFATLAELRGGFLCGSRVEENERLLIRFLGSARVSVINADEQTTHHYARIFRQLRDQGTPIPVNDMWIAAIAIQHNLVLYARDRHFDHLPQIPRV